MNVFEQATRMKLRFNTLQGQIGVEDLWDLPLTSEAGRENLNSLANKLDGSLRWANTASFMPGDTPKNSPTEDRIQIMLDVVLAVIASKIVERKAAQEAADVREKKQKIMAIIGDRQDKALAEAPLEDLQAMLASL